jgi:hypothetical protein
MDGKYWYLSFTYAFVLLSGLIQYICLRRKLKKQETISPDLRIDPSHVSDQIVELESVQSTEQISQSSANVDTLQPPPPSYHEATRNVA